MLGVCGDCCNKHGIGLGYLSSRTSDGDVQNIKIDSSKIWTPDIEFYNV